MFYPANTKIKCTSLNRNNNLNTTFFASVKEINFDFDPEFINGVKVVLEDGSELYVDDISYRIEVLKFPIEYWTTKEYYYVLQNKLDQSYFFTTDLLYENNKWMHFQMCIIEKMNGKDTYRQAYRHFKIKYLNT